MNIKVVGLLLFLFAFTACGRSSDVYDTPLPELYEPATEEQIYEPLQPETALIETATNATAIQFPKAAYSGFVDERFELISLIFRLAGRPEHSNTFTPYQQKLSDTFSEFSRHDAVIHARGWGLGFDAVLRFAVHMEWTENGFVLIDTNDFLINHSSGSWNKERAEVFIELVNDFYLATGFATFFRDNIPYFLEHSERFRYQLYDNLNKDWFYSHGISPDVMRAVISPATSQNGYASLIHGADGNALALYGAIAGTADDYSGWMSFLVHEFVHGFANAIAAEWYEKHEFFRQFVNDSVDLVRMPFYSTGLIMANEYVTRAYTILYMVENEGMNPIFLLLNEKAQGFPNIVYVYFMITGEYLQTWRTNIKELVLGADYEIDEEEFSFPLPTGVIRWHFINIFDTELDLSQFSHSDIGNIFGTTLGDVMYVTRGDGSRFLYIDIGDAGDAWSSQHRSYAAFPLD